MAVIETRDLTKIYGSGRQELRALDQLNLQVQQGEIFGYLGPNGAGKTTTIRLLLDLIRPSSGSATVLGMDAQAESVALHKRVGFFAWRTGAVEGADRRAGAASGGRFARRRR